MLITFLLLILVVAIVLHQALVLCFLSFNPEMGCFAVQQGANTENIFQKKTKTKKL